MYGECNLTIGKYLYPLSNILILLLLCSFLTKYSLLPVSSKHFLQYLSITDVLNNGIGNKLL